MDKSDWIVLRLLRDCSKRTFRNTPDMDKTIDYLESKYGVDFCMRCWDALKREEKQYEYI